jgi:hypothetical protein
MPSTTCRHTDDTIRWIWILFILLPLQGVVGSTDWFSRGGSACGAACREERLDTEATLSSLPPTFATCHRPMQTHETGTVAVWLSAALAAGLAYAVYAVIYNVFFHPLAKFSGPPLAGVTIYWKGYVEVVQGRSFCHFLVELHAQYGEIARYSVFQCALTRIV